MQQQGNNFVGASASANKSASSSASAMGKEAFTIFPALMVKPKNTMQKLALLLLLLGWSQTTQAQTNYIPYHQRMVDIEQLILQEAFSEAEVAILQLFTDYEPAFADDLLLAAQLCALNGHDERSLDFLEKALQKGVEIEFIKSIPALQTLLQTTTWKDIEERLPRLRYDYATSINMDLAAEFRKRFQIEQAAKGTDRYPEVVQDNFDRIIEVIAKYGFPGEELIGYYTGNITVTLLHQPYAFSLLQEELYEALKNGQLPPGDFLNFYVFESRKISTLYDHNLHAPQGIQLPHYNFLTQTDTDSSKVRNARYQFGIGLMRFSEKMEIGKKYGIRF